MTSELDVDRVLEDWFAKAPAASPTGSSVKPSKASITSSGGATCCRRERERMTRLLIAGTGLAAALVAAVVGFATLTGGNGIGGPGGVTYTSDRHGYSVFLPDGWTVEERPGTWELGQFFDANSEAGVDYFEEDLDADGIPTAVRLPGKPADPGRHVVRRVGRPPRCGHGRLSACFELVGSHVSRVVDGETARVGTQHCEDFDNSGIPYTGVQTMVAHDGRGYAIYVWPAPLPGFRPPGWEDMPDAELEAAAARWLDAIEFTD